MRKHGTYTMYRNGNCRCDTCREANTRYFAQRRKVYREGDLESRDVTHGTQATYSTYGCRCELCVQASRAQATKFRLARKGKEPPERVHGTLSGYINWKCRCDICRAANSVYMKAWRQRQREEVIL